MTITLTINNQRVVAPDGATILEAARGAFLRDLRASRSCFAFFVDFTSWSWACLKRIRKSVQRWNKEGGRQGYLTFVGRFVR